MMTAQDQIEAVYESYKPRMVATLNKLGEALREAGYTCDAAYDLSCDQYEWAIAVEGNGLREQVDIRFEVAEAVQYDGEPENGLNFALDVTSWGGEILGGLTPYNYTSEVWVHADDPDAVEARFRIIEEASPASMVELIDQWRDRT